MKKTKEPDFGTYHQGMLLGELVAIELLTEQARTFNEEFSFNFTNFTGKKIVIKKQT
jgi:hypothetical protein